MENLPEVPGPIWEWRDGKMYYVGPPIPPRPLPPVLTPEELAERNRLMDEFAADPGDYDFEAFKRLREFERGGQPYEEYINVAR